MTITADRAALMLRVAELEAEVRIWRAAAVARTHTRASARRPAARSSSPPSTACKRP
ncbi:hypothetical protein [Ralstonia syzygii]|uniref:hypothetical protein n=1 Tax=Ralstonia syzygii TaxID=28097 RepID=UPI001E41E8D1|nr:hypothetical protein [Ralstonia syzygii]